MAKIEGLERSQKRLARIPQRMRIEVRVVLDKSADELVAMQKRLVAVDEGDLRVSIRKRDGRHDLSVEVFTDDFKARWIEFGTVSQPSQPYFFGPYRASKKRIKSRTTRAMRKAVKGK